MKRKQEMTLSLVLGHKDVNSAFFVLLRWGKKALNSRWGRFAF